MLHPPGSNGLVTVGYKESGRWTQKVLSPTELPYVVKQLAGQPDYYLSQSRFRGSRAIARLAELGVLWSDLDYYRVPQWYDATPHQVLDEACRLLAEAQQPWPTMAISSGRGLYVCWRHTPIPRAALPRWKACQRAIQKTLRPLGADPLALDGARVLRLVGTRHSRSQQIVEFLAPPDPPTPFDELADAVLPFTRAEMAEMRAARPAKSKDVAKPKVTRGISTWWALVLDDLQGLLGVRWAGSLPPGQRDGWMLAASVAASWMTPAQVLAREASHLGHEVAYWSEGEVRSRMQAVLDRAWKAAKGETIEWRGRERDPRYYFRRQTLVDMLEISDEEMRQAGMRALVTEGIRREHDAGRKREARRAAGVVDRDTYERRATDRAERTRELAAQGWKQVDIARELGVSKASVSGYLKRRP